MPIIVKNDMELIKKELSSIISPDEAENLYYKRLAYIVSLIEKKFY